MVYKKVVGHFKRNYKTYVKGFSYGAQALALASKVASLINVEKKTFDTQFTGNVLSTTPQIDLLTGIGQGVGYNQREGLSCSPKSMFMRFKLAAGPSQTAPANVRIMVICDKNNNNATAPTTNDIFEQYSTNGILSMGNIANKERFKIMMDKLYQVDNTAGIAGLHKSKYFKFGYVDKKVNPPKIIEHKLTWRDSNGGNTEKGHMYIVYMTDASSNQPSFYYNCRTKYVDN